ncbi:MAG TPA: hypothetical protein VIY56_05810, partial [Vicinamibacterales bacterium]
IGMPRKGGYDVAAFVKGRPDLAHIPVLLLAGAFEPVDQARAEQVRADGVLIKPFEPRQVIERVKELLASSQRRPVDHTAPVIEGSLAHPVVEEPAAVVPSDPPSAQETAPPAVGDSGQSLDELFESLNQALSASAKTPSVATIVPPAPVEPEPAVQVVAPPTLVEPATPTGPAEREPELSFEPLVVARGPAGSLDDYFDRLSAAFTYSKASATPIRLPDGLEAAFGDHEARGFEDALVTAAQPARDAAEPPQEWLTLPGPVTEDAGHSSHSHRYESNPILDAVTTLLARPSWHASRAEEHVEVPEHHPFDTTLPTPAPEISTPAAAADSLDIVDEVTERVLAKLAPAVAESLRQLTQQEVERRRQGGR